MSIVKPLRCGTVRFIVPRAFGAGYQRRYLVTINNELVVVVLDAQIVALLEVCGKVEDVGDWRRSSIALHIWVLLLSQRLR